MKNIKDIKTNLSNLVIKYKDSKDKEDHEEELNSLWNDNYQLKSELNNLNKMLDDIKNDQQEKANNYYGESKHSNYFSRYIIFFFVWK